MMIQEMSDDSINEWWFKKWVMIQEMSDDSRNEWCYLGMILKELFISVQIGQLHVKSVLLLSLYCERQGIQ